MKNRFKIALLFILSILSILSVGFASWTITSSDTSNLDGTISTDEVVKPNFISLEVVRKLMYSMDGFVGTKGNKMTVKVVVDLTECRKAFGDNAIVKVDVYTILDDNVNDNYGMLLNSIKPETDSKIIDLSISELSYEYEVSFVVDFNDESNDVYFSSGSPLLNSNVFAVEAKISVEE